MGLGSNQGDRAGFLAKAREWLARQSVAPVRFSRIYETEPVGCPAGTPSFLNAAAEVVMEGAPSAFLAAMLAFERECGRDRASGHPEKRTLDLDLLYWEDWVVNEPGLILPHPRMLGRRFVMEPLADVCPDRVLPGQTKTVRELRDLLPPEKSFPWTVEGARCRSVDGILIGRKKAQG